MCYCRIFSNMVALVFAYRISLIRLLTVKRSRSSVSKMTELQQFGGKGTKSQSTNRRNCGTKLSRLDGPKGKADLIRHTMDVDVSAKRGKILYDAVCSPAGVSLKLLDQEKRTCHYWCQSCRWLGDTAEQPLFYCPQWSGSREDWKTLIGMKPRTVEIPDILLGPEEPKRCCYLWTPW